VSEPYPQGEPLAHSARDGAPEQTYREHVANVCRYSVLFGKDAAAFSPRWREPLLSALEPAAAYHDLGKLDALFQEVLHYNRKNKHGFNHVEAGTAHLLRLKQFEAAFVAYSHHIGLPSFPKQKAKAANKLNLAFRDDGELVGLHKRAWEWTDKNLENYLSVHHGLFPAIDSVTNTTLPGLARRIALSCLVDADHSDTARHYQQERELRGLPLQPGERLARLDRYVADLARKAPADTERERERLRIRQEVYHACRHRVLREEERIVACDSPVGTGKTTAVMAHLLNIAVQRRLRRVFVVLPYTNIIDQSVDIYRRALVLEGESPEAAVAAHHHRVEFKGESWRDLRQLTQRWDAPIVVTTAVQFFETLAASQTTALRKLHQVPGSAIFVDESHAAMPAPLWPQMWRWLRELCTEWSCHLVLASGSLARFWELEDFVPLYERPVVAELVSDEIRKQTAKSESVRVELMTKAHRLSLPELADFVQSKPGPRLVILNTVQSSAVLAEHLRADRKLGAQVEHLSTALSPRDRTAIVERIRQRLKSGTATDWILVATSCVEAGVDFSFRTAFRESCGLVNLLQVSGRANRGAEYDSAEVWDFRHDEDGLLTLHPHFKTSRRVLEMFFREGKLVAGRDPDSALCTEALRCEINLGTGETEVSAQSILQREKDADYPEVARLCRLITADTETVLVNQDLVTRFETRDSAQFPSAKEVMLNSVQVWKTRLPDLDPKPIGFGDGLFALRPEQYDGFLGYMRGLLPSLKAQKAGGFCE
jgi:CRISPR-associated endonuclease Cas3-HD